MHEKGREVLVPVGGSKQDKAEEVNMAPRPTNTKSELSSSRSKQRRGDRHFRLKDKVKLNQKHLEIRKITKMFERNNCSPHSEVFDYHSHNRN